MELNGMKKGILNMGYKTSLEENSKLKELLIRGSTQLSKLTLGGGPILELQEELLILMELCYTEHGSQFLLSQTTVKVGHLPLTLSGQKLILQL